jgi:homoserine kinase
MSAKKKRTKRQQAFHLALPATSANLGPAFDAAAIALDLYIEIDVIRAANFSITANGRDSEICREIENHLILTTYREILQAEKAEVIPVHLKIKNDIPIGKGCGSSAAARLAGIALANHFGRLGWGNEEIIAEAARREHHADNASACWLGGLTVAVTLADGAVQAVRLKPKGKWPLLLAIPDDPLSTEEARRVLPTQYSRADTVANIQNSMLLLAAFTQGRHDLLRAALEDRIHQPYRAELCPLMPRLCELKAASGVLGAALSGAGPSVIVFLDPNASAGKARKVIASHLAKAGLRAELLMTSISPVGVHY